MSGEPCRIGWIRGRAGSGSPVSCRKRTSVIPQVSTVCPVRTRTPGVRSAQGAIASARGPTRKKRPEGRALGGRGAASTQGLADPGGGRGRIGPERLPIGWQLRPSRPSSQQVPEETEGGAGARAASNFPLAVPTSQVTFESQVASASFHGSAGHPSLSPAPQSCACIPKRFKDPGVCCDSKLQNCA